MKNKKKQHETKGLQELLKHRHVSFDSVVDEPRKSNRNTLSQQETRWLLELQGRPGVTLTMLAKIINRSNPETKKIVDRLNELEADKPFKDFNHTLLAKNVVDLEIPKNKENGALLAIGDIHYNGDERCYDHKRLMDTLDYCNEYNHKILLMGDLIDCNLKNSIGGGIWSQRRNPSEQLDDIANLMWPYRHLICGVHLSNHEYRVFKDTSFEPLKIFSRALGVPLLGHTCYTEVIAGKEKYYLYSLHGTSAARTLASKINALRNNTAFVESADAHLMGHVHELDASSETRQVIVNGKQEWRKVYYVLTGHYLIWKGSYAEMASMRPGKMGSPKLIFDKNRHHLQVLV